jgi:hypothetical protein
MGDAGLARPNVGVDKAFPEMPGVAMHRIPS